MVWIKNRIDAEYRKFGKTKLDWSQIAESKIISQLKEILFESIKECDGETFVVDIGEYNKVINSAHELEDIFERKLNATKGSNAS